MGTKSRLHKLAVSEGKEKPFRPAPLLRCLHCDHLFTEQEARAHIRVCWDYPIKDDEPIPARPILGVNPKKV